MDLDKTSALLHMLLHMYTCFRSVKYKPCLKPYKGFDSCPQCCPVFIFYPTFGLVLDLQATVCDTLALNCVIIIGKR